MREPADRFEGLAETYALHRPGYPVEAFRMLFNACATDRRVAVDLGAGPGNPTAALRATLPEGWLITAVEPGAHMRRVLARSFSEAPCVQVANGRAEAVPLSDVSAGLVAACTAFHWFDRAVFFGEAARVLAPGGVLPWSGTGGWRHRSSPRSTLTSRRSRWTREITRCARPARRRRFARCRRSRGSPPPGPRATYGTKNAMRGG
jgi:SAM-dependent methyltransferase